MRVILSIIFFFAAGANVCQEKLSLYGKAKYNAGTVVIRLIAPDEFQYRAIMKNGINVWRKDLGAAQNQPVQITNDLKHFGPSDTLNWKNLLRNDTGKVGLVYNALFPATERMKENSEAAKYKKMIFDLLMLSCDFDKHVARACGLIVYDTTAEASRNYEYSFTTTNSKGLPVSLLKLPVNTSLLSVVTSINDLTGKAKGKVARLNWNAKKYSGQYGGFNVERSEDSISFTRINKAPLILLRSGYEKNKEKIFFNDTMPSSGKIYYYRLKAIDFFGDESLPSNVVKLGSFEELSAYPLIESTKTNEKGHVTIEWRLTDTLQNERVKKYFIESSFFVNKKYSLRSETVLNQFTDTTITQSQYYRVGAITFYDDTLYSHARLAVIADSTPPPVPVGLSGFVDKKGNVSLRWNPVNENSLKGYKIFRANSLQEEFVQINNKFISDTIYQDKIELNTLSRKIYYSVAAVDGNYNNSERCTPVLIKRPDTIPPPKPTLFKVETKNCIPVLTIIPSLSDDIERHIVYRKSGPDFEMLGGFSSRDSVFYFTDSIPAMSQIIQYKVSAMDESWNVSESEIITYSPERKYKQKIKEIQFAVDRREKFITLSWNYSEPDINRFIIYRGSSTEPLTIIKTLGSGKPSYTDRHLNIGNEYEYRIKAVFADDNQSLISDPVKITY